MTRAEIVAKIITEEQHLLRLRREAWEEYNQCLASNASYEVKQERLLRFREIEKQCREKSKSLKEKANGSIIRGPV